MDSASGCRARPGALSSGRAGRRDAIGCRCERSSRAGRPDDDRGGEHQIAPVVRRAPSSRCSRALRTSDREFFEATFLVRDTGCLRRQSASGKCCGEEPAEAEIAGHRVRTGRVPSRRCLRGTRGARRAGAGIRRTEGGYEPSVGEGHERPAPPFTGHNPIAARGGPVTSPHDVLAPPSDPQIRRGPVAGWMIAGIRGYQLVRSGRPTGCRYLPTCSDYAVQAIEVHGATRGASLTLRRLMRCTPWGGHGVDPVPDRRTPCLDH